VPPGPEAACYLVRPPLVGTVNAEFAGESDEWVFRLVLYQPFGTRTNRLLLATAQRGKGPALAQPTIRMSLIGVLGTRRLVVGPQYSR
jgi:hypothetical protein